MYSNETKNFNLPQFLATDKIDPVADFNPAFETIDNQMQQNKITAEDALAGVTGAQKDAEDAQLAAQRAENAATAAAQSAQEANENAQNAVQKVDDLEKEVESIQDAQTAQGTQISELSNEYHVFVRNQTALNTAQDNINTNLQEKDAAIEGQISALDTRVTKNESDIKALQESTASDKAELDQKIEMNAQVLSDTRNTVTTHTEQISTLTETVEHNSDDIETAQTAIAGNSSDIVKVYGKAVPAEADPNLSNTALAASGERHREAIAQIYGNYPVPNIESTKNLQGLDQRVRALESGGGDVTKDYVDQQDATLRNSIDANWNDFLKLYGSEAFPPTVSEGDSIIGMRGRIQALESASASVTMEQVESAINDKVGNLYFDRAATYETAAPGGNITFDNVTNGLGGVYEATKHRQYLVLPLTSNTSDTSKYKIHQTSSSSGQTDTTTFTWDLSIIFLSFMIFCEKDLSNNARSVCFEPAVGTYVFPWISGNISFTIERDLDNSKATLTITRSRQSGTYATIISPIFFGTMMEEET